MSIHIVCITLLLCVSKTTSQWRHKERNGVSNHRRFECLRNRLFRRRSKKTSKLRATGLCEGNSPLVGEFPAQRASIAENVFIWWRHQDIQVRVDTGRHEPNYPGTCILMAPHCGYIHHDAYLSITRTRWRREKTLGQHQVGVNFQSHAQHQLLNFTWCIFHEFQKRMPG